MFDIACIREIESVERGSNTMSKSRNRNGEREQCSESIPVRDRIERAALRDEDRIVLDIVNEWRCVKGTQLYEVYGNPTTANQRLANMVYWRLVDCWRPAHEDRNAGYVYWRYVSGFTNRWRHHIGVYECYRQCKSGYPGMKYVRELKLDKGIVADLAFRKADGSVWVVEFDTGRVPRAVVEKKLQRYKEYLNSVRWKQNFDRKPKVRIVVDGKTTLGERRRESMRDIRTIEEFTAEFLTGTL